LKAKKLGRKKNLERLAQTIEQLRLQSNASETNLKQLKSNLEALKSANQQRIIQQKRQKLAEHDRKLITLKSKIDSYNQFKQETVQRQHDLAQQLKVVYDQENNYKTNLTLLQKRSINLRQTVSEKDAYFQNFAERMSDASTQYNLKHIEQVRHQNAMTTLEKELDFCHRQLKDLNDQRQKDEDILGESGGDLSSAQAAIQVLNQALQDYYASKKKDLENLVVAEKLYFKAKGSVSESEKELKQQQRQYTQVLDLIGQLDRRFNDVKLQLTSIAERLNVEFEIKINDLVNENPNPEFEEAVLESNVGQLRERLQNYGPINPMAIEAYDEILERNQLIEVQKTDLEKSKANLLATIAEIERKATERFLEAFNKVRGFFVDVFRSLFHEDDTCDLKLSNPNSPLDSKIEIIAQPKGKRPLSINQLSGGEKTLTATALLFALYLLKPAPFCVFDEVDAPLDDANIAKFNNIIKDFSTNSQFVIVTHNKKTMESVDIMYGVTMVRGISRVVPVDFRALESLS
jgi:chromosome segregation protein